MELDEIKYSKLFGFITTYRCPLECDFCCFECSPKRTEFIDEDDIEKCIIQLSKISNVSVITFSGGEPLLLDKSLYSCIEKAEQLKFTTRLITSGYWGKYEEKLEKVISKLKNSGLKEINVSTGDYHNEFVNWQTACNVAVSGNKSGFKSAVVLETIPDSTLSPEMIKNFIIEKTHDKVETTVDVLHNCFTIPHDWEDEERGSLTTEEAGTTPHAGGCPHILNSLSMHPDNNIYACCGLKSHEIPDLQLGSLDMFLGLKTKQDFRRFVLKNLVHLWLAVDGPEKMARLVEKEIGMKILHEDMKHPCHACIALFSNDLARNILINEAPAHKDKIILKFLQLETTMGGRDS